MIPAFSVVCGDALTELSRMGASSVQCCVTSPPYWGLRDYGVEGQLGQEHTPEEYVAKMVDVFREVKCVLADEGTLWINLGDSYTKDKNMVGIPWRVAFALQADGWLLRSDVIWSKPNPMPESVTDRPTKAHEYIFLLAKSDDYYYDYEAIRDAPTRDWQNEKRTTPGNPNRNDGGGVSARPDKQRGHERRHAGFNARWDAMSRAEQSALGRNKRSVWHVATRPFPEAHFATFPPQLIEPCILAGCPVGGTVLDPFTGSGTTGVVANSHARNFVGIELNPTYADMARKRIGNTQTPMLLEGA